MKPRTHSSTISFSIPGEGDSPMMHLVHDEIQKMVKQHRYDLSWCLYTGEPLVPRPEYSKFRRWLGWKVHGLAARLNPDVVSY